jgi:glycine cleavage system transcriptional repressor
MGRLALSALGVDRPGIVAAVTGVLVELGCNLEDSTMSILQGHFAILLVVEAPDAVTAASLEESMGRVAQHFGLVVAVRGVAQLDSGAPGPGRPGREVPEPGPPGGADEWTIAVYGTDRAGIVHAVTSALADSGGNVVDLTSHLVGEPGAALYVMTVRATLPGGPAGEAAVARVHEAAEELGVHCTVHRDDPEIL